MDLLKLTFLVLLVVGPLCEGDAFALQVDDQPLRPPTALCVEKDADAPTQNSSPSEGCHFVQRLAKRKPGVSILSCTAQHVAVAVNSRSLRRLSCSYTVDEEDLNALYRFLRVYRC